MSIAEVPAAYTEPAPVSARPAEQIANEVVVQAQPCSAIEGSSRTLNFSTDRYEFNDTASEVLDEIVALLGECKDLTFMVAGHTDSRGATEYNQALSERRAFVVIKYLNEVGVDTDRLLARALGEMQPVDDNSTEEGRRNNRRVELVAM